MPSWLILIFVFLVVLGFIQAIIWLNNFYLGPLWQRRIPKRKSSRGLLKADFSFALPDEAQYEMDGPASAVALVGEVQGYAVEISSNYLTGWWTSPFYRIRVFFATDNLTREELVVRRATNLSNSKFFRWNDDIKLTVNHTDRMYIVGRNGSPSSEFLLIIAKELIAELKTLGLKPVDYVEGIKQWRINQD